ncbi:MAG: outer membrane protein transport protein [Saprospiraceae bacterium]|nr:outer membrane protein transport protein [Saprospiraceae bacterium]
MKRYFLPIMMMFLSASAFSQTVSDVLRYSYLQPGGTARYLGAGGAFGALGAEFGAISQNPAGLAMFRTNELIFTPSLKFTSSETQLAGGSNQTFDDDKSAFGFDNFGMVFNTTLKNSDWKTFNVAIGLNRQNNYHQSIYYEGQAAGSIMNGFFEDAQATFNSGGNEEDLYPFGSGLAWNTNAIYLQNDVLDYDFSATPNAVLDRSQTLTTYGRMNEMILSFAGNYDERLMVGATVGVPFVNYRIEGEYNESDPGGGLDGNAQYFDNLTYTEYLRTEGIGVNLKLGVTYKISQALRIGGAFHTPTALRLTDTYSNTFAYTYEDGNGLSSSPVENSPEGTTDYRLRTPWRAIASAAVVIKKYGFLSADVEWVDYGANRYNLNADVPSTENERIERELNRDIQQAYQQAMNVRLGGELAVKKFRLRAGVNLNGKPEEGKDDFSMGYSVGAGVRGNSFYLDLGYRRGTGQGSVAPYAGAPVATTDVVSSDVLMTLGFKF